ncbi:hypothetical protein D3C72_1671020 [compost metagenome]
MRQHDAAQPLHFAQAQCAGRLVLARVHRLDAASEQFSQVRAEVQGQAQHAGHETVDHHPHLGQPVVDVEQLQQQRRAADHLNVEPRAAAQQARGRQAAQADDQAQRHRQKSRTEKQRQSPDRALGQRGQVHAQRSEIQVVLLMRAVAALTC